MPLEWKNSPAPVAYPEALEAMEQRVEAILRGEASELIWLLEHPPLYTAGTSAKADDLLQPQFPVYDVGRGGQYTYHGPGQRVVYVVLDLNQRMGGKPDLRKYVWLLEEWIIRTLAAFDVQGERREGRVGIWVSVASHQSPIVSVENKIAALGIRVRKWVSFHGMAINLNPDLSHYAGIVPCGISEYGVTSLAALGKDVTMEALDAELQRQFALLDFVA
jgi:lipoyl(octanoyl) transferase